MSYSVNVSIIPTSIPNVVSKVKRPSSASYHPTIWADLSFTHVSDCKEGNASIEEEVDGLKEEVRKMLSDFTNDPFHKLHLVNIVQRLGLQYHFQNEIGQILAEMCDDHFVDDEDLCTTSTWFRLLRQQGVKVSCNAFEKFKDSNGEFKESLIKDIDGMLSLYEAAHLGIKGEHILDEALTFATKNLQSKLPELNYYVAEEVRHALNRPIRKCLPRLEARHFISIYSRDKSHNQTLLELAILDFNRLQQSHRKELNHISEWWKSLDVKTNYPFIRDRIVELYFWMMGVYFEPQFSIGRAILTKVIAMANILDDTYDNSATYEELQLLTDAIQRWDIKARDVLPERVKMIFSLLIDTYKDFEENLPKEVSCFLHHAKEATKRALRSALQEAQWREEGYIPTMEEYMEVSLLSCYYPMLATASFIGMGALASNDVFQWVQNDPKIVIATATVCRLMDDIVSHEFEQKREHVASAVECYMMQYGATEEVAVKLFRKEIENAWKNINEACLDPTPVPMPLLERVLNLARAMDVMYKDEDGFTNSHVLKDTVASVLKGKKTVLK